MPIDFSDAPAIPINNSKPIGLDFSDAPPPPIDNTVQPTKLDFSDAPSAPIKAESSLGSKLWNAATWSPLPEYKSTFDKYRNTISSTVGKSDISDKPLIGSEQGFHVDSPKQLLTQTLDLPVEAAQSTYDFGRSVASPLGLAIGAAGKYAAPYIKPAISAGKKLLGIGETVAEDMPKVIPKTAPTIPPTEDLPQTPVEKLMTAVTNLKPVRANQEYVNTAERANKIKAFKDARVEGSGEAGANAQMAKLAGSHEKVAFEPIRDQFTQPEIDHIYDTAMSALVDEFTKPTAKSALDKIFHSNGVVSPTNSESKALEDIFGTTFVKHLAPDPAWTGRINSIMRGLETAYDLSGMLRQGRRLSHTSAFYKSIPEMMSSLGSEEGFNTSKAAIKARDHYDLATQSGVQFTELGGLNKAEEYVADNFVEKIPGVRASNRAHIGFLNNLRSQAFEDLTNKAIAAGHDPYKDKKLARDTADFVNNATGRGSLGSLEDSANGLNKALFAPRLIASWVHTFNPATYMNYEPMVRKEALKSLLAVASSTAVIDAMAAKALGAKVETDMRSSDFGKIKIGNARVDLMGGGQQYLVLASRLASGIGENLLPEGSLAGSYKDLSGNMKSLNSRKFNAQTGKSILEDFGENKLSPMLSLVKKALPGATDFSGQPIKLLPSNDNGNPKTGEIAASFAPLVSQDLADILKDDPSLSPLMILDILGAGVQDFQSKPKKGPFSVSMPKAPSFRLNAK